MFLKTTALTLLFCNSTFGYTRTVMETYQGATFRLITVEDSTGTHHRLCTGGEGPNECFPVDPAGLELCIYKETGFDCRPPLSPDSILESE